jgi:hypothetical protein
MGMGPALVTIAALREELYCVLRAEEYIQAHQQRRKNFEFHISLLGRDKTGSAMQRQAQS